MYIYIYIHYIYIYTYRSTFVASHPRMPRRSYPFKFTASRMR